MAEENDEKTSLEQSVLNKKINDYLKKEPKFHGALAGIKVVNLDSRTIQAERMNQIRLRPASNMKLLTAMGALAILGEDYKFETKILINGYIKDKVLVGDLYLKGKGDPTILIEDLEMLAREVISCGIEKIEGNLIADDTWYDDVRLSQDMIWNDETFYYGSQVSALTVSPNQDFDTGTMLIKIKPAKVGEKPCIDLYPKTSYLDIINKAQTSRDGTDEDLIIERERSTNTVIIKGYSPISVGTIQKTIAVSEPTIYTLTLFGDALNHVGVTWTGALRKTKESNNLQCIYRYKSPSLASILIPFMKLSNNGHGEILIKEMGKVVKGSGSWVIGLTVLNNKLKCLGMNTEQLVLRDGSGISHGTLISADAFVNSLFIAQKQPWFQTFKNSLPIAGEQERMVGGTLKDRLSRFNLQAKTGTINSVSTLSGYLQTKQKNEMVFSVLLNNLLDEEEGTEIIDHIIELIINYG